MYLMCSAYSFQQNSIDALVFWCIKRRERRGHYFNRMRFLIFAPLLTALVSCQVNNGFVSGDLPNVVLSGEPRVIARRILRGEVGQVQQDVVSREPQHVRINVQESGGVPQGGAGSEYQQGPSGQPSGIPVVVYRRILRPARLQFNGKPIVTDQWQGDNDQAEQQSFFELDRSKYTPLFESEKSPLGRH
ncbi:unnamed protein product [Caenorhabditis auriculariae]|uniref:Uncharacterized protein n=1 Tax=Caenorhabditis auriculariae TaxID=2777116 RepID=A0A8S1H731_9PELO|nr:unnamed protein product [Caenorhabditis auriculariae]